MVGPKGFTNPVCQLDLRPGGTIRIDMTAPDGTVCLMAGLFRVIDPLEHLLFTSTAFPDDEGGYDVEVNNTLTFVEKEGKTEMMLHAKVVRAKPEIYEALAGMQEGWEQSFDKLEDLLNRK